MEQTTPPPATSKNALRAAGQHSLCNRLLECLPLLHHKHAKKIDVNMISQAHEVHLMKNSHKWSSGQRRANKIISHPAFDCMITALVLFQLGLGIHQTDLNAEDKEVPQWMATAQRTLLAIYLCEIIGRLYVFRIDFFRSKWHWLDIGVVGFDLLNEIIALIVPVETPSFSLLRMFRILRVVRAARLLRIFPELFIMIHSLAGTIRVVFWAGLLVAMMTTMWSLIAVDLIHPLNVKLTEPDDFCRWAFDSVYSANLTFLQVIVAGDSFGTCTMPIMRKHPWTVLYFIAVLATVGLGALNLILSAIVDRATEVREENEALLHSAKLHHYELAGQKLQHVCQTELDEDGSGEISLEGLLNAFEENNDFRNAMESMEFGKAQIYTVYTMMDETRTGTVGYVEFAEHLLKLKTQDQHMLLIMLKQFMNDLMYTIQQEFELMKVEQEELQQIVEALGNLTGSSNGLSERKPSKRQISLPGIPPPAANGSMVRKPSKGSTSGSRIPTASSNPSNDNIEPSTPALSPLALEALRKENMIEQSLARVEDLHVTVGIDQAVASPISRDSPTACMKGYLPTVATQEPMDFTNTPLLKIQEAPNLDIDTRLEGDGKQQNGLMLLRQDGTTNQEPGDLQTRRLVSSANKSCVNL